MKPLSSMDSEELNNAVDEKKALPDMILKRIIFNAQERMNLAESTLLQNKLRDGINKARDRDMFILRGFTLQCWRLIGEMAKEGTYTNLDGAQTFGVDDSILIKDLYLKVHINERKLHHFVAYINYCLHKLNLTNLLLDNIKMESDEYTY